MTKKRIIQFMCLMMVFGIGIQIYCFFQSSKDVWKLKRPNIGEDEEEVTLEVKGDDRKEIITFDLDSERPTEEEIQELLEQGKEEALSSFLGENRDFDQVESHVVLNEEFVDGKVEAIWTFLPTGIISGDGSIAYDSLNQDETVTVSLNLKAYDEEMLYTFPIVVKSPSSQSTEGFRYLIEKALRENNEADATEMQLPKMVGDTNLHWKIPISYKGFQISILGLMAGVVLLFGKKYDEHREKEKIKESYIKDYPEIVSALVLYMGVGMSAQNAFLKIGESYKKQRKGKRDIKPAYENIIRMNRGIADGRDVRSMLEDYGRSCCHPAYEKLVLLLNQNMKKGNEYLLEQLEREEKTLYENQQRKIKVAGEEASTKLLLPLGGLLVMVMIILIMPALATIQI